MVRNDLLSDEQHGFVPGRDCMTQLLLCMEDWTEKMDKNDSFDIIYTDISKAFDSVVHERLLLKLRSIGISGNMWNWVRLFLTGRTQCVNIEGIISDKKPVTSGVPQGSFLAPLLFVIFINDLPEAVKTSNTKLFADDCKIYGKADPDQNKIQKDL